MSLVKSLCFSLLLSSTTINAMSIQALKEWSNENGTPCIEVFKNLAKEKLISISYHEVSKIELLEVTDLDQGSFGLPRAVTISFNYEGQSKNLSFNTYGDFACNGEILIEDITE